MLPFAVERDCLCLFLLKVYPHFSVLKNLGGLDKDPLWQIDDKNIRGDLEAVQDSPTHVIIMPSVTMSLERYEAALANTQNYWERVD